MRDKHAAERQARLARTSDAVRRHLMQLAQLTPEPGVLVDMAQEAADWARGAERPPELARATEDPGLTLNRLGDALTALRELVGATNFDEGCSDLVGGLVELWEEAHRDEGVDGGADDAAAGEAEGSDTSGTWAPKVGAADAADDFAEATDEAGAVTDA